MLIISTGSNIGDRHKHLRDAKEKIAKHFKLIAQSSIYTSKAVDYLNQPDFLNQVIQCEIPDKSKEETISLLLNIEEQMGRTRVENKGPRTIDLDIIFWGLDEYQSSTLTIPHPSWRERSFIVLPLLELPYASQLSKKFKMPTEFKNSAKQI